MAGNGKLNQAESQEELLKLSKSLSMTFKPGKRQFCGNTNCSTRTLDLVPAPGIALSYFGMGIDTTQRKICRKCLQKAEKFEKISKNVVRNQENLFSLKCEVQSVQPEDVVDLELEDVAIGNRDDTPGRQESKPGPDVLLNSASDKALNKELESIIRKFNVVGQMKMCLETAEEEADNLGTQMDLLGKQMETASDNILEVLRKYNEDIVGKPKSVELGSIELSDGDAYEIRESDSLKEQLAHVGINNENLPKPVVDFQKAVGLCCKNLPSTTISKPGPRAKVRKVRMNAVVGSSTPQLEHLSKHFEQETPKKFETVSCIRKLVFTSPKINQVVYAMSGDPLDYWRSGKIVEIFTSNSPENIVYTVEMDVMKEPCLQSIATTFTRKLSGKQIAFKKPSPDLTLPVGSRVIAKFQDELGSNAKFLDNFFVGVVAESRSSTNKNRYLVFFDDGYSQYTQPYDVVPVVASSPNVWDDVHIDGRSFIKEYIERYPDRPLLVANLGDRYLVEFKGEWIPARVTELDCSLMKVQYLKKTKLKFEWIYRGSARLAPIFNANAKESSNELKGSSNVNAAIGPESLKILQVASQNVQPKTRISKGLNQRFIRKADGENYECDGVLSKILIPPDCPESIAYVSHFCSSKCVNRYEAEKFRGTSPLVIPFHLGWKRLYGSIKCDMVCYITPCGLRLSTYEAIRKYNRNTHSDIPIEFFSLKPNIDCLNQFIPIRKLRYLNDLSYGKEWIPVQCVNSIDFDLPEHVEYLQNRVVAEGVEINDDKGFMVCCDCKDDCKNKLSCVCWQRTLSGNSFQVPDSEEAPNGYEYRRLKNVANSGIYECNQNCKCNTRACLNRVVQNKVVWPMQVFKTLNKGWGVRTLHDVPRGTFICVYAGKLLNDAGATEEGLNDGDEYLADLDYIEAEEVRKDGYESACSEVSDTDLPSSKPKTGIMMGSERQSVARKSTSGIIATAKRQHVAKKSTSRTVNGEGTLATSGSTYNFVRSTKQFSYRRYFGKHQKPYIIDGKKMGNFGRYFNHSCDPNLFIQNVFVDTHDLRFPWVAFFTSKDVKAGTELCWDYKYEVGSVPGKCLYCYCGSKNCRKRLL